MNPNIYLFFNYFMENEKPVSFEYDEEEKKAYDALEKSFSSMQKKLFLDWENYYIMYHCEEMKDCFEYAFKKGVSLALDLFFSKNNP